MDCCGLFGLCGLAVSCLLFVDGFAGCAAFVVGSVCSCWLCDCCLWLCMFVVGELLIVLL